MVEKGGVKMNKNIKKIGTMVLVAIVAVGSYFVAGTYAKYTTSLSGESTATVAKWAWNYKGTAITKDQSTITFNLFDTIKSTDGATENNVHKTDGTVDRIAPGTSGSFAFDFQNLSEVNAKYSLTLVEEKGAAVANAKIQYSLVGTAEATDWTTNLAQLANESEIAINMDSAKVEKTVYWKWVFDESTSQDAIDTQVGFDAGTATSDAAKQIKVTATVAFTQVD